MPRYIDATALRKEFSERPPDYYSTGYILDTIDEQPTISPDEVRGVGEWIVSEYQDQTDVDNGNYMYFCSKCGKADVHASTQDVPFCWNCGARMKGAEDSE